MEKYKKFEIKVGLNEAIIGLIDRLLENGVYDAAFLPLSVPAGDSYAWVLLEDRSLLEIADIMPPVMPVQGGRALSSLTKHGKLDKSIIAVMRPCEVRATIELAKIGQADLENITIISYDCPGVMPLGDFLENPNENKKQYKNAVQNGEMSIMRPTCKACEHFGYINDTVHIGTLGLDNNRAIVITESEKTGELLSKLNLVDSDDYDAWKKAYDRELEKRKQEAKKLHKKIKAETGGLDNFTDALAKCISCHNCMNVCPVCYCQRCYFESDALDFTASQHLKRAESKGLLRFSPEILMFHLGRMSHMTASCVSCGTCEDACPVDIPIAQLFSTVGADTQALFEYTPGIDIDQPQPLRTFQAEKELGQIEGIIVAPLKAGDNNE
ncbi:MAG: 4Fe-4S dicluster domain-containing protein [Candidatus Zixiibacteriota bacterium]